MGMMRTKQEDIMQQHVAHSILLRSNRTLGGSGDGELASIEPSYSPPGLGGSGDGELASIEPSYSPPGRNFGKKEGFPNPRMVSNILGPPPPPPASPNPVPCVPRLLLLIFKRHTFRLYSVNADWVQRAQGNLLFLASPRSTCGLPSQIRKLLATRLITSSMCMSLCCSSSQRKYGKRIQG